MIKGTISLLTLHTKDSEIEIASAQMVKTVGADCFSYRCFVLYDLIIKYTIRMKIDPVVNGKNHTLSPSALCIVL